MANGDGGSEGESRREPRPQTISPQDTTALERLQGGGMLGTEELYQLLRQVGLSTAPAQTGLTLQGLLEQTRRIGASPELLRQQFAPQIRTIRDQLQQTFANLSRRLGPAGRAQIRRGQEESLTQAGSALQRLFAGGGQGAVPQMMQFLSGLRPALLTQLPQLTQSQQPADWSGIGKALAGAGGLAGQLFGPQNVSLTSPAGFGAGYTWSGGGGTYPTTVPTGGGYAAGGGF